MWTTEKEHRKLEATYGSEFAKADKIMKSCKTEMHIQIAMNFYDLLQKRYEKKHGNKFMIKYHGMRVAERRRKQLGLK